jgi:hypothetical protein
MNFGRAERARYLSDILPIYGDFLRKCYSKFIVFQEFTLCLLASKAPQECQSRAIPDIEGFERMVDMEVDPDSFVNVDPVPERTQSDTVPDIPMPPSPACARFRSPTPFSPSHRPSPPPSRDGSLAPSQAPSPKAQLPVAPIPLSSAPLEVDMNGDPSPALSRDESIPRSRTASVGVDVEAAIEAESVGAATRPPLVTAPAQTTPPPARLSLRSGPPPPEHQSANPTVALDMPLQNPNGSRYPKRLRCSSGTHIPPESKRPRKSAIQPSIDALNPSTSQTSIIASVPSSDSPDWFKNAMEIFNSENLGKEWKQLVDEWGSFEGKERYLEAGLLPSAGRPKVVKMWVSRGRKPTWRPDSADLIGHEMQFSAWWVRLQPDWRVSNGKLIRGNVGGSWDSLRFPGKNGLLQGTSAERKRWVSAVEDCYQAISSLCHV